MTHDVVTHVKGTGIVVYIIVYIVYLILLCVQVKKVQADRALLFQENESQAGTFTCSHIDILSHINIHVPVHTCTCTYMYLYIHVPVHTLKRDTLHCE